MQINTLFCNIEEILFHLVSVFRLDEREGSIKIEPNWIIHKVQTITQL